MDWVHANKSDEPTIYEAEPLSSDRENHQTPLDIFSSATPVEKPSNDEEDQCEYFGDEVDDQRMSPAEAFAVFAGRTFPLGHTPDFSGSIYAEGNEASSKGARLKPRKARISGSENRSERLIRLQAEVDALTAECALDDKNAVESTLTNLSTLRDRLHDIEIQMRADTQSNPTIRLLQKNEQPGSEPKDKHHSVDSMSVQVISPKVSVIQSLESRVSAVEESIGISCFDDTHEPIPLAQMLEDIRARLGLITDETLPEKLKQDAQDIAKVLQSQLQSEKGSDIVRMASMLQKMDKWEIVAESVPIVIERLRCLKRVQDEAAGFVENLSLISKQVDGLQLRSETNKTLIENVRRSLKSNIETVNNNLEALNKRVSKQKGKAEDEG